MIDSQHRLGVRPTGRVDDRTYLAVRAFQMEQGLRVTGELDPATVRLLRETRLLGPDMKRPPAVPDQGI